MIYVERYHDISSGHRVVGHEGKCALLHGHNYRFHFTAIAVEGLDEVGRVVDFSVLKSTICQWLEDNWDHRFLAWEKDQVMLSLRSCANEQSDEILMRSIVWLPFNPTAENLADHIRLVVSPLVLPWNIRLTCVRVEETRKCSAISSLI